ncbi:hypothetical protein Pve01_20340 [Planomonospora venezuelensis]|nr:hypothetical protein Pve01_20340 [Planomonospora venezuelensis]
MTGAGAEFSGGAVCLRNAREWWRTPTMRDSVPAGALLPARQQEETQPEAEFPAPAGFPRTGPSGPGWYRLSQGTAGAGRPSLPGAEWSASPHRPAGVTGPDHRNRPAQQT